MSPLRWFLASLRSSWQCMLFVINSAIIVGCVFHSFVEIYHDSVVKFATLLTFQSVGLLFSGRTHAAFARVSNSPFVKAFEL